MLSCWRGNAKHMGALSGLGVAGASGYLAQLFALTWAGSQVTKVCPTMCLALCL
jgi:hypothetical protein